MKTLRAAGLAAALCAVGLAGAETGSVTVSASLPFVDTDWSNSLVIPQYNNPLFHLDSVDVLFHGAIHTTIQVENRNVNARKFSVSASYGLVLTGPSGQLLGIHPASTVHTDVPLAAYDKVLDYAGTSGITYPMETAEDSGFTTLTSVTDLAAFTGTGTIALPVAGTSEATFDATGNFDEVITNQSAADVQVTYHYSYTPASVGDRVWVDSNNNGIQDAGEANVPGVTVLLLDGNGTQVGSTTTDANGNYLFSGLIPGDYQVRFIAPAGTALTTLNAGASDVDSDAGLNGYTTKFTLHSGEARTDIDAGLVGLQSVGDFVWLDSNANGIQEPGELGLAGVGVTLYDSKGNVVGTQTTDGNGNYLFTGLMPGDYKIDFDDVSSYYRSPSLAAGSTTDNDSNATADGTTATFTLNAGDNRRDIDAGYYGTFNLGDRVWFDSNRNGIQDDGERGIAGVTVTLFDGKNNQVGTQVTDPNGNYLFTNLMPDNYTVKFTKPTGYTFTGAHAGADISVDSDADGSGVTQVIALTADNLNVDAGLYGNLCLGDRVWKDLNKNGLQDSGEPGVPGVAVHLLDKDGNVLADTTTDANGLYKFTNLAPGDYKVDFDAPAGYGFTTQFVSPTKATTDSNADVNTGIANVTLSANDNTIDAGLVGALKIGDTVWCDSDGDGVYEPLEGEKGIKNVRITLYGDTNNDGKVDVTLTTTTDANGHYLFMGLNPGTYQVVVNSNDLPSGVKQTYDLDGLSTKNMATAKLLPGVDNLDFDFGYKPGTNCGSCNHSWWGCNPSRWNCDNITIGGKCHTRTTICNWMSKNDCGDKSICVYQRLCASKLNVGNGCSQATVYSCGRVTCSVKDAIKKCDDWMSRNPVGCKVSSNSSSWNSICDYYGILAKYCGN